MLKSPPGYELGWYMYVLWTWLIHDQIILKALRAKQDFLVHVVNSKLTTLIQIKEMFDFLTFDFFNMLYTFKSIFIRQVFFVFEIYWHLSMTYINVTKMLQKQSNWFFFFAIRDISTWSIFQNHSKYLQKKICIYNVIIHVSSTDWVNKTYIIVKNYVAKSNEFNTR